MKQAMIGLAAAALAASAMVRAGTFDADTVGASPAGWTCGITGKGAPLWAVAADKGSSDKVLLQKGSGAFPCA